MAIPYEVAMEEVFRVGTEMSDAFTKQVEMVPIVRAVGRVSQSAITSLRSTPAFDTSAMDGYAVDSRYTANASPTNPVHLLIKGTMGAGDRPTVVEHSSMDRHPATVEIMTGAQFPKSDSKYTFDACVKIEDTKLVRDVVPGPRCVEIRAPVRPGQNRRGMGFELANGDRIISGRSVVQPSHVMALASVGINRIAAVRRPRVAVICTGSELLPFTEYEDEEDRIRDSNGPYIKVALEQVGVEVGYLGIVKDDVAAFERVVRGAMASGKYDVIVSTGAVSVGKFDFVREGIDRLGARIHFHKIAIRPGAPVLFATLPSQHPGKGRNKAVNTNSHTCSLHDSRGEDNLSDTAFFGLPGNPVASAVCLRFIVMPYLRHLQGLSGEEVELVKVISGAMRRATKEAVQISEDQVICTTPAHLDVFRPAHVSQNDTGAHVQFKEGLGAGKMTSYLSANYWVRIPRGQSEVADGDLLQCYPMLPKNH